MNLGRDTDTVGAVYGQIAGCYYGEKSLPIEWKQCIVKKEKILSMATQLNQLSSNDNTNNNNNTDDPHHNSNNNNNNNSDNNIQHTRK